MTEPSDLSQSRRWRFGAEAANNIVQTIAIVAAGAWAVYTFIYQAKIAPAQEPPSLSVTTTLAAVGHKGDQVAVRSTVTRSNVGHTGLRLLALTYNVVGRRVRFGEQIWPNPALAPYQSSRIMALRYYTEPDAEVIVQHGVLFKGAEPPADGEQVPESVLYPGETISRDMMFYADRSRFDSIRFQVRLSYVKETDPPVPLRFHVDEQQQLEALPVILCRADDDGCTTVVTTDFATDLSLW